jgi:hypothetical protein
MFSGSDFSGRKKRFARMEKCQEKFSNRSVGWRRLQYLSLTVNQFEGLGRRQGDQVRRFGEYLPRAF